MRVSTTQKLWRMITPPERRSALLLLGLMLVGMTFETLGVGLIIPVVMILTRPDYAKHLHALKPLAAMFNGAGPQALVVAAMLGLTAVFLVKNLFLAFLVWWQTRFSFAVRANLSRRLFTLYLRQPYSFHLQRNSAHLLRNVIDEVSVFTNSAMIPGLLLLSEILVVMGVCTLLISVEPVGALMVVGIMGIAAWGFHHVTHSRVARWGKARQYHEGLRIQHLQQGLGGAKDVKLLGREAEFLEQYRLHNTQSARAGQLQSALQQLPRLWLELLAVGGLAMLVLSMLAQGRALEAIMPTVGLFAAGAFRLMPSANRMLGAVQSLRYGLPVVDNLESELKLEVPVAPIVSAPAPFTSTLELDRVSFTYAGSNSPVLQEISISVQRGESVGFVGASGAGKSTLVDILLGLLSPDSGEVCVDGVNIQSSLRNWQTQIGYVPQSIYLTDDTLRRNVAFGLSNDQIDDAAVWRAIRAAQLDEYVNAAPDGLDTLVGERGVRLSGGQCQRIGIARALYHDPVVLVLDEATSSLDTATESGVMDAVQALHGAKTILIVSHRLSTVAHCDRIYRMAEGRVVAAGTPDILLRQIG